MAIIYKQKNAQLVSAGQGKWLRFVENREYVYEEEFLGGEKLGVLGVSFQKKMNSLFIVKVFQDKKINYDYEGCKKN